MPLDYRLDKTRDLAVFHGYGVMTQQEALDVIDKSVTDSNGAAICKNMLLIIDEAAILDAFDCAVFETMKARYATWLETYPRTRDVKCAIVVTGREQAERARLWGAVSEADPAIRSYTQIFDSEDAAVRWLKR